MDNEDGKTPATLSDLESSLLYQVNELIIERDALKSKVSDHEYDITSTERSALLKAQDALLHALGQQVEDNVVERGVASVIFAEFANQLDKTGIWTNPFKKKFTVKVSHCNDVIMTISGVQAEDEEDAIETVNEAISLDSPARKGTLTYDDKNGMSDDAPELEEDDSSIDADDFDLDYEAEEED